MPWCGRIPATATTRKDNDKHNDNDNDNDNERDGIEISAGLD
jgi:hypothetical protein